MSAPVARFALPSLATIYRTALPTHNSGVDGWSGSRSTSLRIDISALDPEPRPWGVPPAPVSTSSRPLSPVAKPFYFATSTRTSTPSTTISLSPFATTFSPALPHSTIQATRSFSATAVPKVILPRKLAQALDFLDSASEDVVEQVKSASDEYLQYVRESAESVLENPQSAIEFDETPVATSTDFDNSLEVSFELEDESLDELEEGSTSTDGIDPSFFTCSYGGLDKKAQTAKDGLNKSVRIESQGADKDESLSNQPILQVYTSAGYFGWSDSEYPTSTSDNNHTFSACFLQPTYGSTVIGPFHPTRPLHNARRTTTSDYEEMHNPATSPATIQPSSGGIVVGPFHPTPPLNIQFKTASSPISLNESSHSIPNLKIQSKTASLSTLVGPFHPTPPLNIQSQTAHTSTLNPSATSYTHRHPIIPLHQSLQPNRAITIISPTPLRPLITLIKPEITITPPTPRIKPTYISPLHFRHIVDAFGNKGPPILKVSPIHVVARTPRETAVIAPTYKVIDMITAAFKNIWM